MIPLQFREISVAAVAYDCCSLTLLFTFVAGFCVCGFRLSLQVVLYGLGACKGGL